MSTLHLRPLLLTTLATLALAGSGLAQLPGGDDEVFSIPGEQVQTSNSGVQLVQAAALIRAVEARANYGVSGAGQTCAVIDSGARVTHADFAGGKILATVNFTTDDGGAANLVTDGHGHGSNAAGIIAAKGVHTGIAPGGNLVILKAFNNAGSGNTLLVGKALQWVLDHYTEFNIRVVNMSLGNGANYQDPSQAPDPAGLRAKIQQLRSLNIAVVVSAGNGFFQFNSAQGMESPAIFPETVSVSGVYDSNVGRDEVSGGIAKTTGPNRILAYGQRLHETTNATSRTDIFAPGALLTSTGASGNQASSTFHGTSEAAPMVSGLLLLLQEKARSLGVVPSVDQLETWLRAGALPITDGDDEDDNVNNTGKVFLRADAVGALQSMVSDLAGPNLANCDVLSRTVTRGGNNVWIYADATDARGVASVSARVSGPTNVDVPMTHLIGPIYRGTFTAPANTSGANRVYAVTIRATSQPGRLSTLSCGVITVLGAPLSRRDILRKQTLDRRALLQHHRRETLILRQIQLLERRLNPDGLTRRQLAQKQLNDRRVLTRRLQTDRRELQRRQRLERFG